MPAVPLFVSSYPDITEIGVTIDEVLEMLHQTERSEENPIVYEAKEIYSQLPGICDIRGGYAIFDRTRTSLHTGKIHIGGIEIDTGNRICNYMKDADQIALFICTAGEEFTRLTRLYNSDGDYLKGFIVDTYGSLVVEKAIEYIQHQLEESVQKSELRITNRYSPGYCNWALTSQQQLFGLLPENECRISLTESSLMLPIKSVSGIIGIGKNVIKNKYACEICNNQSCVYRNIRQQRQAI